MCNKGLLNGSVVRKNLPAVQDGGGIASHSSILAWGTLWTEKGWWATVPRSVALLLQIAKELDMT